MWRSCVAVSYTHLDVYKRQVHACDANGNTALHLACAAETPVLDLVGDLRELGLDPHAVDAHGRSSLDAVSYTHLDVYKRQLLADSARLALHWGSDALACLLLVGGPLALLRNAPSLGHSLLLSGMTGLLLIGLWWQWPQWQQLEAYGRTTGHPQARSPCLLYTSRCV